MTFPYWSLIVVLAVTTFSIKVLGLFAGDAIKSSKFAWMLNDLPGLIIVSLVASSLAGQSIGTWIAAVAALAVAYFSNHVIVTMGAGVITYGSLVWLGF